MKTFIFLAVLIAFAYSKPFASFTTYQYNGCSSSPDNYVTSMYLYPADGSCFVPAGGLLNKNDNHGYQITYDDFTMYVNEYLYENCTQRTGTTYVHYGKCDQNIHWEIYDALPAEFHWTSQGISGPNGLWETVLVTTFYAMEGCQSSYITAIQIQGWPKCTSGTGYYCDHGQLTYQSNCADSQCTAGCDEPYKPLNDACTTSIDADWTSIVKDTAVSYQATCVGSTLASPSPSPSPSASPGSSPSPSPSPAPYTAYAAFTSYYYAGCNATDGNSIYDLYLYPADGSCFSPAGGIQFLTTDGYQITYNQTTVIVADYDAQNCSGDVLAYYYYPIGSCLNDTVVSVYPSLPSDQYWLSQNLVGLSGPWETILVTNYYTQSSCQSNSLTTIQVQGWPECFYGSVFYCKGGEIYNQACVDTVNCASGCMQLFGPLSDACTPSEYVPTFWSNYLDYSTSNSYQASCVGGVLPTPSPTPSTSPSSTPSRSPAPASPSPSPAPFTAYASFLTYTYDGCNATANNSIIDLFLYPADGSCFVPAGGYDVNSYHGYTITYNQTTAIVNEYDSTNCTDSPMNTQYYPIGNCAAKTVVSIYSTLPDDQYWLTQGLVDYYQEPWSVILVTNYYSDSGCYGSNLISVQVQGWPYCYEGLKYFCDNGEIALDICADAEGCLTGCIHAYAPLNDACTLSSQVPYSWSTYIDYTTSVSYQASCVQVVPTTSPSASPSPGWRSPSPTPGYDPFVSFTTWEYDGCNSTMNNYVHDLYLYPADGSCFVPAGGFYFFYYDGYRITYNQTTVTVYEYGTKDCSDKPTDITYYPIGTCSPDVEVAVYPTLPSDQYWLDASIEGAEPWQTVLVTSYFSALQCPSKATSSIQVQGFQTCLNGYHYYCNHGEIELDDCSSADCSSGCSVLYSPLDSACTASDEVSSDWAQYIDYYTSTSFQASCVDNGSPSSGSVLTVCGAVILAAIVMVF